MFCIRCCFRNKGTMSVEDMTKLVERLERVACRLESVKVGGASTGTASNADVQGN